MSWENTIKKEDSNDEELKDFIDLINLNLRMYEKTKKLKYLKIMKGFVEEEIKRVENEYDTDYY